LERFAVAPDIDEFFTIKRAQATDDLTDKHFLTKAHLSVSLHQIDGPLQIISLMTLITLCLISQPEYIQFPVSPELPQAALDSHHLQHVV
jgi:hypothetical protein